MYDKDQDNLIGVRDLKEILVAILNEHKLVVSSEEIEQIVGYIIYYYNECIHMSAYILISTFVEATFKEADPAVPGKINYDE